MNDPGASAKGFPDVCGETPPATFQFIPATGAEEPSSLAHADTLGVVAVFPPASAGAHARFSSRVWAKCAAGPGVATRSEGAGRACCEQTTSLTKF